MTELQYVTTYKDGGSKAFKDKDGNKYWQCFKLGMKHLEGQLFKGEVGNYTPVYGDFVLVEKKKVLTDVKTTLSQKEIVLDGVKISRNELKTLLSIIKTVRGDHNWAENINMDTIYEIADRHNLEFVDARPNSVFNTERLCVDKC